MKKMFNPPLRPFYIPFDFTIASGCPRKEYKCPECGSKNVSAYVQVIGYARVNPNYMDVEEPEDCEVRDTDDFDYEELSCEDCEHEFRGVEV